MKTVLLGDVYDIRDGTHDSPKYHTQGYPLVTSKNLKNHILDLSNVKLISKADYLQIRKRSGVSKGDVLMAMIGTIGNPVVITEEPNYAIKNVALFKVSASQNNFFLKYYLDSQYVREKMQKEAKGTTQKFVGLGYLRNFPIKLPSLEEQKRIVKKLDEAFGKIDKAIELAQKNLQNSQDFFESYLESMLLFKDSWERDHLVAASEKITDGSHFSPKSSENGRYPYVTVRDINNDIIDFTNCKRINEKSYNELVRSGCKPINGDLLYSKDGTVGKVSYVNYEKDFVVLSSLAIIRPKQNIIASRFLMYILKSRSFLNNAIGRKTGTAISRIVLKNLKTIEIAYPKELSEQNSITAKLDRSYKETQKLQKLYQQKLDNLQELKQSLLKNAFEGKL